MAYNPSHLAQFFATEISVFLSIRLSPQITTIQIKLPRKPFPATVETSHTCPVAVAPGRQWPWLGVAGVAGVQYYFFTFDLHAIFNVFLCYTLLHADLHGHGWPERKLAV
jgi:hypothetical protein